VTIVADDGAERDDRSSTTTMGRSTPYDRVFESVDADFLAGLCFMHPDRKPRSRQRFRAYPDRLPANGREALGPV